MMSRTNLEITAVTLLTLTSTALLIWIYRRSQNPLKTKGKKRKPQRRNLEDLQMSTAWENVGKVKNIWIYPVKSCAGIHFKEAVMEKDGPQSGNCRDRWFVIIDEKGIMISARKITSTLSITPAFDDKNKTLTLNFPNLKPLKILLADVEMRGSMAKAKIWDASVAGFDCGDEVAEWLTGALNHKCRLLYYGSAKSDRTTVSSAGDYPLVNLDDTTFYTDSDAYLLMNEASLMDLEKKTARKHHPQNFRPNLFVEGPLPYDEDDWTHVKIGEAIFRNTKPCPRCTFPTIDFRTGKRDPDIEPLKTLRRYRCPPGSNHPEFGIYLATDKIGRVQVGDEVFVFRD